VGALSRLTVAALIGLALALVYVQAVILKQFELPLTVFAGLMLATAGLIATGWRWVPLVGAALSALVVVAKIDPVIYDLTHPESFHLFAYMLVAVALALVGFAGGIGAAIQNYRGASQVAPRGAGVALALLTGVCAGALLIGALPRESGASVSPELLAGLPAIITPGMHFDQAELTAKVGETVALRLENPHAAPHSFDIDELNVHVPASAGKQALVMFQPTQPGTYTFYCAVPGHREAGMEGKLVVTP
jgi:uncharacterized cupredoxin-like copper-binding protein